MAAPKRLAFLVFPRLTLLDLIGAYDALRRVASMSIDSKVTHRIIGTDAERRLPRGQAGGHPSSDGGPARPHCREVVTNRRVVDEGRVVTAGGVSSSLDLGLYLVEKYWGADARVRIAHQMKYRGYSPA